MTLPPGGDVRCDLQPRGGATLRGTVTTAHGALPDVVQLYLAPGRTTPWTDGQRGGFARDGSFEIPGLEAGTWQVSASGTSADVKLHTSARLEIPAESVIEVRLALEPR